MTYRCCWASVAAFAAQIAPIQWHNYSCCVVYAHMDSIGKKYTKLKHLLGRERSQTRQKWTRYTDPRPFMWLLAPTRGDAGTFRRSLKTLQSRFSSADFLLKTL